MTVKELINKLEKMPQDLEIKLDYMASMDDDLNDCEMSAPIRMIYALGDFVYIADFNPDDI